MSDASENLTRGQERLIAAMLTARTIGEAAQEANTSEATARRWLTLPQVQRAYLDARRRIVDAALTAVQSATREAVDTLRACLAPDMPPAVRVRSATAILDTAVRAVEVSDLATRIDQLEQALHEQAEQQRMGGRRRYA